MTRARAGILLRHVRKVVLELRNDFLSDGDLLRRFVREGDQSAFTAVVRRHGLMVLHVCQRALRNWHDAEDVFQATFLALARKAPTVAWHDSVAGWLYLVAVRLARRSKARADRRAQESSRPDGIEPLSAVDPASAASSRELFALIHEQIGRLPDSLRAPLVLCCLEGLTREEAARQLGWSLGTLKRRLERARDSLRARLDRAGVGAPGLALGALAGPGLAAEVPAELLARTAAQGGAAGTALAPLATGVRALLPARRAAACVLLAGLSAGGLWFALAATPPRPPVRAVNARRLPAAPPAATTVPDEPLPRGALTRLGSMALRGRRLRFLPDGRLVRDHRSGGLQISEVPSGRPLVLIRGTDVPQRDHIIGSTIAFTCDARLVAGVCWGGRTGIWATTTGKLVRWLETGLFYSTVRCDFSPDGKLLAVGTTRNNSSLDDMTVGVYEVATGKRLFETPGSSSAFAPDGKSMVVWQSYFPPRKIAHVAVPSGKELGTFPYAGRSLNYSRPTDGTLFFEPLHSGSVRVREVASGKVKHTLKGPSASEKNRVDVLHADGGKEVLAVGGNPAGVWCWDLDTGKELWQVPLVSPWEYHHLSADGTTVVTNDAAGIRIWETRTGKLRSSIRAETIGHSRAVGVSPDGKTVATMSGGWFSTTLALWSTTSGKLVSDVPGHLSALTAAAFSPDGERLWTLSKDRTLRTWQAAGGKELSRVAVEPSAHAALSADGTTLFLGREGGIIDVVPARSGKVTRSIAAFTKGLVGLALTADGKRLVSAGRDDDYLVRVHDAATGAKLDEFARTGTPIEQLAIRPDGETVATTHPGQRVILWDRRGKKLLQQQGRSKRTSSWMKEKTPYRIGSVALSADGHWLAYSDQDQGVALVDLRTGKEVGRAKPGVSFQTPAPRDELRDVLAFSPDGKTVAWSGTEATAEVFVIEVRTRQVRRQLSGEAYPVSSVAWSPEGSKLLSGAVDGSALVWDILDRPSTKAGVPSAAQVAGWWEQLAEENADKGYTAMRALAEHPAAALALLREKLKPIQEVPAARLDGLVAALDAEEFASREKASRELAALGDAAEARLRAVLGGRPALEVRRRAEEALGRIEANRLRPERAVEVLERIGNDAAVRLLRELAGGMRGAARTDDAAGALARLAARMSGRR
jgi:RNA polymerase sigma factor (sigma-70 family)